MEKIILYFSLFGIFCKHNVFAQDSLPNILLDKVEVFSTPNPKTIGLSNQVIETTSQNNFNTTHIGELLSANSNVFIKNYGPGGLSTSSIRGGTAQQTAVYWNGLAIQSPMLGQIDFSYFPASTIDKVEIQYGSGGAMLGNNTQAGAILLDNLPNYNNEWNSTLNLSYGSFSTNSNAFQVSKGSKKYYSSLHYYTTKAKNNFVFYNPTRFLPLKEQQQNADITQNGVMAETYFKIKKYQELNIRFWLQESERGTGKPLTKLTETSRLFNNFYRITSQYNYYGKKSDWTIKGAFFTEKLNYNDSLSAIYSNSMFLTTIVDLENTRKLNQNFILNSGVLNTTNSVQSNNYSEHKNRNTLSVFTSLNYNSSNQKFKTVVAIRKEIIKGFLIPIVPTFGADYLVLKAVALKLNISKNYRIPTFNDLYFVPFGKLDILPENGWSGESSILFQKSQFKSVLTFFVNDYSNMLVWQPKENFWQPTNQHVLAQGIENRTTFEGKISKLKWKLTNNTTYKQSINKETRNQLIYNPNWTTNCNATLENSKFSLSYNYLYIGKRFTSTDNLTALPNYNLGSVFISSFFEKNKINGIISFQINNIWNTTFTSIENYPMPLRNYMIKLKINFKNKL